MFCDYNKIKTLKYFPLCSEKSWIIDGNKFPDEIYNNKKYLKDIIKYQYEYGIWNYDDSLNLNRFKLMMEEIKSNHLV